MVRSQYGGSPKHLRRCVINSFALALCDRPLMRTAWIAGVAFDVPRASGNSAYLIGLHRPRGENGKKFLYLDQSAILIGWVMERAAGKDLAQLLTDDLWGKLGERHSHQWRRNHARQRRCGTRRAGTVARPSPRNLPQFLVAHGGLLRTIYGCRTWRPAAGGRSGCRHGGGQIYFGSYRGIRRQDIRDGAVVVYAVAANYAARMKEHSNSHLINDELLRIMQSATLGPVH